MNKTKNNKKSEECVKKDVFFGKATKGSSAIKTVDPFSDSDTETDLNKARITNRIRNIKKSVDHMKNDNFLGKATKGSSVISLSVFARGTHAYLINVNNNKY